MKKRILIVDDDARNIFALSATLRARQFECLSCTGAAQAITLLENDNKIDAVLLDMMMPDMDGYDAIPLLRRTSGGYGIPIIAVTAQAMVGDRERCIEAGANDYVSKPVDVDKLLRILSTI
ncbi:response regulator [Flavobacterium sp. DG1-102-2]|uniref:response regulator n=1 Tax=Flavobacterium sp. DG1-102-2 TaxID=3081663 RepID=UPI00294A86AB|nr:response regulator [Flavobacterium sp. DG1-102-2]MDV6166873.1 response regulator [Flavobacterium sp. DG1-102-2]